MSKYEELEQLLDGMDNTDYWHDEGTLICDAIIDAFTAEDWRKLNCNLSNKKSSCWFYFLLYSLSCHLENKHEVLNVFITSLRNSEDNDNYEELLYLFFEFLQQNKLDEKSTKMTAQFIKDEVKNEFWQARLIRACGESNL